MPVEEMSNSINIPIGFRFDPTEEELIRGFLFPKVSGLPVPPSYIADRGVYGKNLEPWIVFSDADADSSPYWATKNEGGAVKKTIYVFARVTKAGAGPKSTRNSRIAGCGTWSGQSGPKDIKHADTGAVIGCSRMLAFECSDKVSAKTKKKGELGHWIMHEYCLTGAGLEAAGLKETDVVLCKITKIVKKKSDRRRPVQPAAEEGNCGCCGIGMKRSGEGLMEEEGYYLIKKQKSSSCSISVGGNDEGLDMAAIDNIDIESSINYDC